MKSDWVMDGSAPPKRMEMGQLKPLQNHKGHKLLQRREARRRLVDLELPELVAGQIGELIEEHLKRQRLAKHGFEPRNRVILIGPPGNGKTSLAEAIAAELRLPFYVVRYSGVVSSGLGETTQMMVKVFEEAATQPCVLFFDEFEGVGRSRGKAGGDSASGEITRMVGALLMEIERLPSTVIAVAATNHAGMLDRAMERRFQIRLTLPGPTIEQARKFLDRIGAAHLAEELAATNFSELEEFLVDVERRAALSDEDESLATLAERRLVLWKQRAEVGRAEGKAKG